MRSDQAFKVFPILSDNDFFIHEHHTLYGELCRLNRLGKSLDFVSVIAELADAKTLEACGGQVKVMQLATDFVGAAAIESHVGIVREMALRRNLIALCWEASDAAYRSPSEDVIASLANGLDKASRSVVANAKSWSQALDDAALAVRAAKERRMSGGVVGVPTGLPALDNRTGGLQESRVYGIAARPGSGKTAILNQIALHAAVRGYAGLICSLEMGTDELVIRALANASGRNVTKITHGYDDDANAAFDAGARLGDLPLWIDTETYSIQALCAQISLHKQKYGIKWAAVDHIGLVETEKFNSRNDQVGHVTRSLKQLAKRLHIPIIAVSQMNRDSEKSSRKPGLHDLRDSGNIEQDLDVALFLHVEEAERSKPTKRVQLGLLKNRGGRVGWLQEAFEFDGATQTFHELSNVPMHWQDRDAA